MKRFLERFADIVAKYPERTALKDGTNQLTYRELDEESGRVYRYLKEKEIGREQFVTLYLKKQVHFVSAMLGVSKAGAAYTLLEEGYPSERVEFIKKDSGSVLAIDDALLKEIIRDYEPLCGREPTDLHDAAYAVYTSGSTGNPKGVLHEYGNMDQCASTKEERDEYEEEIMGFPAALNFVATQLYLLPALSTGMTIYLISGELMRDFDGLQNVLLKEKITDMFFPPSYLRHYDDPSPYLKKIETGSAPAYGIYYANGPVVECNYAMSETGFFVFRGILEKSFDNAPVGRPVLDIDLYLLRDDESIVEGSGEGELCFVNEYVRGYLNLPEQTRKAFRPMKDHPEKLLFHTNDIVRRGEDGRYYIVGRIDDMIKIDGNRIEPGEIESKVKEITGLSDVMAKGFLDKERAYIAVYFLRDEAMKKGIWDGKRFTIDRERLSSLLPAYMIPTYYVPLDAFPLNANGKMTRKELKAPDMKELRGDYAEPETELEKYICERMAQVLKLDRVGATEDFFEAGGDSLRAISLVSLCKRLRLSTKDIYRKRTARQLADGLSFFEDPSADGSSDPDRDLEESYVLLPGQYIHTVFWKYLKYPASINMVRLYLLDRDVDTGRLKDAVNRCIKAHPPLLTHLFRTDDGTLRQRYDASFYRPAEIIAVSREDFERKMEEKDEAFVLEDAPQYRCSIYTVEDEAYLWFSINHIIGDGSSMNLLMNDIYRLYADDAYIPGKDNYFSILKRTFAQRGSLSWKEAEAYYANLFQDELGTSIPYGLNMNASDERRSDLYMDQKAFRRKAGRDGNFYLAAFALAQCWYNRCKKSVVTSGYADRGDADRMNAGGFLLSPLIILLDITDDPSPRDIIDRITEQTEFGMIHTEYSFLAEKVPDPSVMSRFLYQKDILSENELSAIAKDGPDVACHKEIGGVIGFNVLDNTGCEDIGIAINYSICNFSRSDIVALAGFYKEAVEFLDNR